MVPRLVIDGAEDRISGPMKVAREVAPALIHLLEVLDDLRDHVLIPAIERVHVVGGIVDINDGLPDLLQPILVGLLHNPVRLVFKLLLWYVILLPD